MIGLSAELDLELDLDVVQDISMDVIVMSGRGAVRTATSGAIVLPQSPERGDWRSLRRPRHILWNQEIKIQVIDKSFVWSPVKNVVFRSKYCRNWSSQG